MTRQKCVTEYEVQSAGLTVSLWEIYKDSFQKAMKTCAQNQACYDLKGFMQALKDERYAKVIMYHEGEPAGLSLLTNVLHLARVTSMNPQKTVLKYPEEDRQGRIFYCTALAVRPEKQGQGLSYPIFLEMARLLREHQAILAFDYAEDKPDFETYVAKMFSRAVRELEKKTQDLVCDILGRQTYVTMDFRF